MSAPAIHPADLTPSSFAAYSPAAQALAQAHLALLRSMPLSLLPSYLVQVKAYDSLFPVEQERLRDQMDALAMQPQLMQNFRAIELPASLAQLDWINSPGAYVSALSAVLWQTHQIDAYHRAAETLFAALPEPQPAPGTQPPMLVAVFGRDATPGSYSLFARMRSQGMYLRKVQDAGAAEQVCAALARRAKHDPRPYAHWYVDGGEAWPLAADTEAVRHFSFPQLAPVTDVVLREMDRAVQQGSGPEVLADRLREMSPEALGMKEVTADPRMAHFFVQVLTQGSGTQLYSTSFVQAAGVELVRRAQPQTLLLRFAPRRRPASMNDMLEQRAQGAAPDADGAMVDADMGLYYAWLALQRQSHGEQARLLAYVEGHGEVFVAGPSITRGVESSSPMTMAQIFALLA